MTAKSRLIITQRKVRCAASACTNMHGSWSTVSTAQNPVRSSTALRKQQRRITWVLSVIWNTSWLWWRTIRRIRITVLWKNCFPGQNSYRKSAGVKQKQQMLCKPSAGNGGHKMSRYSWFTVYLFSSELVIADISGHNPNVFFEMGYRKCTDKPIIHLKKKREMIPFDVNTVRTFEYDLT